MEASAPTPAPSNSATTERNFDPFLGLASARQLELRGWPLVAALLHALDKNHPDWWHGRGDSLAEVLGSPELQLATSTAKQYQEVWRVFGKLEVQALEQARPRLLYQAVAAIDAGKATPEEALHDALTLSFTTMREKYVLSNR